MTREDVIRMAREAGFGLVAFNAIDGLDAVTIDGKIITDELIRFAALVAAAKQEECAKVCDDMAELVDGENTPEASNASRLIDDCAAAIRALP